jgi:hypothetical protein
MAYFGRSGETRCVRDVLSDVAFHEREAHKAASRLHKAGQQSWEPSWEPFSVDGC